MNIMTYVFDNWHTIFRVCGDNKILICKNLRDMFHADGSRRQVVYDPFFEGAVNPDNKGILSLGHAKMMADWVVWKAREQRYL